MTPRLTRLAAQTFAFAEWGSQVTEVGELLEAGLVQLRTEDDGPGRTPYVLSSKGVELALQARHDSLPMKKRSEVKKAKPVVHCGACGAPQFEAPDGAGITCKNGHGGADSISAAEAFAIFPSHEARVPPPTSGTREKLESASSKLKEAMQEEVETEALDPLKWGSANKAHEAPLDPAFAAIVETLVIDDPMAHYEKLEKALVIGDNRTDYGTVMKHLDEAEKNARMAHRLWQSCKLEQKRWELENEVVFGACRREATRSLQHEKDSGNRSKQITDADVESRVATLFPDEYQAQERKRVRVKSMVDSMQNLAEVWLSRCKSLQVILSKQR